MTVTVKPKAEITVPSSIRKKAGIKPGDRVEFSVSGREIRITPKLAPGELDEYLEVHDPAVRAHIQKSNSDYVAGRSRPAKDFVADLRSKPRAKTTKKSPPA